MHKAEAAYRDNASRYSDGSRRSAQAILRIVFDLVQPQSIVDVGCSIGTWLSVCSAMGATDYTGIDGDYVDRNALLIPRERFLSLDLMRPFNLDRRFDLVISLEVAEHLPKESAEGFVNSLVSLGPVVLFSAAIPFQGGTGHINEQWPDYWARFFLQRGYLAIDCLRPRIWSNPDVQVWYAQNCLLFVHREVLGMSDTLRHEQECCAGRPLSIVHPNHYIGAADAKNWDPRMLSIDQCLAGLRAQIKRKIRSSMHWRLQRLIWK